MFPDVSEAEVNSMWKKELAKPSAKEDASEKDDGDTAELVGY